MKRIFALLLIASLTLGLFTACGDKGETPAGNTNGGNNSQQSGSGIVETGGTVTYSVDNSVISGAGTIDTGSLYVTESMLDTGISRPGSLVRLAGVLEKAAYGGDITIAYIGGSIAMGKGASSYDKSYAGLTTAWFKTTFPNATVNEVNIGAVNCDSYVSAHRVTSEVISKKPDIVIIDTASEDSGAINEEAFESMVRMLLSSSSAPAVIPLVTTNSSYNDAGDSQAALAFKLNLPVISYADVLENNIKNGTWSWNDVSTKDETLNPSDSGHAFIAYLLTGYFSRVLSGINDSKYAEYVLTDSTTSMVRYMNGYFTSPEKVPHDGEDNILTGLPDQGGTFVTQGMATTSGQEATFEVTGKCIGMLYWKSLDGSCGRFDLYVDGEFVVTLDGDLSGTEDATYSYMEYYEIGKYSESGKHIIKLVMNTEQESAGDDFYVCGFTIVE
ncbi:MAG: SGNH/GDSL hydrolase family protein [Lachnospiraceae bacterium]